MDPITRYGTNDPMHISGIFHFKRIVIVNYACKFFHNTFFERVVSQGFVTFSGI